MSIDEECGGIDTALQREGEVLVGWVAIGDYMDADGRRRLEKYCCGGQPHWVSDGMLEAGRDPDWYEEVDEEGEDAEEG